MSLRPGTGSPPSQNLNARLNDGRRVLDVADLRQYIYEQMGRIRTTVLMIDDRSATTMATARTLPITVVTTTLPQQEPGKKEERNAEAAQGFDRPAPATVSPGDIHRGG
jgi:hypothetical protein